MISRRCAGGDHGGCLVSSLCGCACHPVPLPAPPVPTTTSGRRRRPVEEELDRLRAENALLRTQLARGPLPPRSRSGAQPGSRLPADRQRRIADHLAEGCSISETARRESVSRDQVRTVKLALSGTTAAQVRAQRRGR